MMHILLLFLAKYLIFVVAAIAFAYWLTVSRREKLRLIVFGAITSIFTIILVKIGASLYYDPRPFLVSHVTPLYPHGPDNGFPSDHTFVSAVAALTIFSSSRRWGSVLLACAVLIGAARVIGNIHHPIDIIGSLVFALAGYAVAVFATPYVMRRLGKSNEHVQADKPTR